MNDHENGWSLSADENELFGNVCSLQPPAILGTVHFPFQHVHFLPRLATFQETIKFFLMRITLFKLLMTLPGTPFIYYGQELGMSDLDLEEHPKECQLDVQAESRDGCRSPFRWTNSSEENYGFSSCVNDETADNVCERSCTWLPTGYKNPVNFDDQPGFSN